MINKNSLLWPDVTTEEGRNTAYKFACFVIYASLFMAFLSLPANLLSYGANAVTYKGAIRAVLSLTAVICFGISAYGIKHSKVKATAAGLIYDLAVLIISLTYYSAYGFGAITMFISSRGIISWIIIIIRLLGFTNGIRAVDAHNKAFTPTYTLESDNDNKGIGFNVGYTILALIVGSVLSLIVRGFYNTAINFIFGLFVDLGGSRESIYVVRGYILFYGGHIVYLASLVVLTVVFYRLFNEHLNFSVRG